MMIVMKEGATEEQIGAVVERVESVGCSAHISQGELLTVIGAIGDRDRVTGLGLEGAPGVDHLVPILKPYKLASTQFRKGERTVIEIDGRRVGGDHFALIAGPCTVESREQTLEVARAWPPNGASMLRGGAYKPRTSPYSFQGLGLEGLRLLQEAKEETGLPIVTELMDVRDVEDVVEVADVIQIGARNMQNYPLLAEIGRTGMPVLLKRGLSATLDELLMAAEYVLKEGNERVMLCERGIRTLRDRLPVHARPARRPGAAGADAPAGDRRPEPRRRPARLGPADVAGGRGRRRRRDHRRGPQRARGGDLRRTAGDPDRGVRRVRRAGAQGRRGRRQGAVDGLAARELTGLRCGSPSSASA